MTAPAFLRQRDVIERTTLSRTTLWRMIRAKAFPAPVRLGAGNRIAFSEEAVSQWIENRMEETTR